MIVAHRGASSDVLENTLAAFNLAWQQGVDAIEGDFQLTKDGFIVCFHDKNTIRLSDKKISIAQATLAQLQSLALDNYHNVDEQLFIPTLTDVLATIPKEKIIYIEIKSGLEIVPRLIEQIQGSAISLEQIRVLCFSAEVLHALKLKCQNLQVFWLADVTRDADGALIPSLQSVIQQLRSCKADAFSCNYEYVDEDYVKGIIAMGYDYHVWTIDDLQIAKRFIAWGAKSVTTNIAGAFKVALPDYN